jgi:phenylpyruvate tautomerase PptA (4-oxalocrotonate tautomerase family)
MACATRTARGFLGVADTSFVTVIANPAEAANWAAELDSLNNQLAAARGTLQTAEDLRSYAGDPRSAVAALGDLSDVTSAVGSLSSGSLTQADLAQAWQALGTAQRTAAAAALLAGAGPGATMAVFGQVQPRDTGQYADLAADASASSAIRSQVAREQATRGSVASALALAWAAFRAAATESQKQAILSEISQLQSQNQVLDTRRRALLDDLALSDRQDRNAGAVRSRASDEQVLAGSAVLNSNAQARAQGAEAQRMATLQKAASPVQAPDYSGIRLWTTADTNGTSP